MLIFAVTSFVFANSIEANILTPSIAYGKKVSSQSLSSTISHKTKLPTVRITSPIRGQDVPVGKNLVVSGISARGTSNCVVSVIVNGIKPYQNATGIGHKGQKDYSKWTFLLIPKYTIIKEGTNKVTSKFSCGNKPSLVSYYSLNVTGLVGAGGSFSRSHAPAATTNNTPGMITPLP
ncbi:MAG: hypothetical protein WA667_07910 [Candidatus Nitrosopolaris sp.]